MVKTRRGEQGGLVGEDGGQEEDGDEGDEKDNGADKGGAFEQTAVMFCLRTPDRGCEI